MLSHALARAPQPGQHVGELLDGVHLLSEVLRLQEVRQMGVPVVARQLVELQQGLWERGAYSLYSKLGQ